MKRMVSIVVMLLMAATAQESRAQVILGFTGGMSHTSASLTDEYGVRMETDALSGVSTGVSWFSRARPPEAKDKPEAKDVVVYEQGATAGSASARRDQATRTKRPALARKAPLARGRSFFGLRGGTSARNGGSRKPAPTGSR